MVLLPVIRKAMQKTAEDCKNMVRSFSQIKVCKTDRISQVPVLTDLMLNI